jgi:hypothetical protein
VEHSDHKQQQARQGRGKWPWLVIAGAAALLIVAALILRPSAEPGTSQTLAESVLGAPHLEVDQVVIDEGDVELGTRVSTTFQLSNVGGRPLEILGDPDVELKEGC